MGLIRRITGTLRLGLAAAIVLLVVPAITALSFVITRRIRGWALRLRIQGPRALTMDPRPAGRRN